MVRHPLIGVSGLLCGQHIVPQRTQENNDASIEVLIGIELGHKAISYWKFPRDQE